MATGVTPMRGGIGRRRPRPTVPNPTSSLNARRRNETTSADRLPQERTASATRDGVASAMPPICVVHMAFSGGFRDEPRAAPLGLQSRVGETFAAPPPVGPHQAEPSLLGHGDARLHERGSRVWLRDCGLPPLRRDGRGFHRRLHGRDRRWSAQDPHALSRRASRQMQPAPPDRGGARVADPLCGAAAIRSVKADEQVRKPRPRWSAGRRSRSRPNGSTRGDLNRSSPNPAPQGVSETGK
jgi:hypothetical protein